MHNKWLYILLEVIFFFVLGGFVAFTIIGLAFGKRAKGGRH